MRVTSIVITIIFSGFFHVFINSIKLQENKNFFLDWLKARRNTNLLPKSSQEDAKLKTDELIRKYNYPSETHFVKTEDSYILTLHRISNPGKQPVLLMHGFLDSSAAFILMGPKISLGYLLFDQNFDVWLGNSRGNRYSKNHTTIKTNEKIFWDFSWHEVGIYDLPAMINYIGNVTSFTKLFYVGHSQGATAFFVMCSIRPEFNDKIILMQAFAPIIFIEHIRTPLVNNIESFLSSSKSKSITEFMPQGWFMQKSKCFENFIYKRVCLELIFSLVGRDAEQLNETMLPVIFNHIPSGGSVKQLRHFAQNFNSKKFQFYDYGRKENLKRYNQKQPLKYNLSKVIAPVILYYGPNDNIAPPEDVRKLYRELGDNILGLYAAPPNNFNHMDFVWAVDVRNSFFDKFLKILKNFQDGTLKYVVE